MSYGYGGFAPYVSVAEKKAKADRQIAKLMKKDKNLAPVLLSGRTIAATWWGKAWVDNLESYADYANRIDRGRSYVRNHAVLDLKITEGQVQALVMGSSSKPYKISVTISPLPKRRWDEIIRLCDHRISSVEQLADGKFPKELSKIFTGKEYGLFPSPEEISFACSCPDYAYMCKHVAAVLYGIGARFDQSPLLFFQLRSLNYEELMRRSVESRLESMLKNAGQKTDRSLAEADIHDLFGI